MHGAARLPQRLRCQEVDILVYVDFSKKMILSIKYKGLVVTGVIGAFRYVLAAKKVTNSVSLGFVEKFFAFRMAFFS